MIEIYLRLNDYFYWKSSSYLSNGTENVLHPLKLLLREYSTTCFNTNKVDTFKGYIKIVEKREDIAIDKFMNILANREVCIQQQLRLLISEKTFSETCRLISKDQIELCACFSGFGEGVLSEWK